MNKQQIKKIVQILKKTYPDATCSLDFKTPFQLVVAVCLSAQCTDERVNKTTPALFDKCKTIKDFSNINLEELENLIHPCGFYKNKAKNIKKCAKQIISDFNGKVPEDIDKLMTLAGVGRKSANVIMLEVFNNPQGIAVDTHCKRISNRLGLSKQNDPIKIEQDLLKLFDKTDYKDINHLLVWHGRKTCKSQNPNCNICTINHLCKKYLEENKN